VISGTWWLSVGVNLARVTSTVTRDEVTPNVLHGESAEGNEVVRHREKARSAANDDEDGSRINWIGRLNRGCYPCRKSISLQGRAVAEAGGSYSENRNLCN
jgi:hypothetical protein